MQVLIHTSESSSLQALSLILMSSLQRSTEVESYLGITQQAHGKLGIEFDSSLVVSGPHSLSHLGHCLEIYQVGHQKREQL